MLTKKTYLFGLPLNEREKLVLGLLANRLKMAKIAKLLGIHVRTVYRALKNAKDKLGAYDSHKAANFAYTGGMILGKVRVRIIKMSKKKLRRRRARR